ncbi:MAG: hypothetical protein KDD42_08525, partial [Bdellovibrionales bacterium]|nr:hypothetical protein [Bdellovibrionales bacterium]
STTLLMLSASISNASEIAEWIEDVRGRPCEIVIKKERPVELRYGFLHPELGVVPLTDREGRLLRQVARFYGASNLDDSGMILQGGRFKRRSRSNRPFRRSRNQRRRR